MNTKLQVQAQAPGQAPDQAQGQAQGGTQPWWRYPIVWLMVGLPAVSVIAGFAMLKLAVSGADLLVMEAPRASSSTGSAAPALKARNHAATGVQ